MTSFYSDHVNDTFSTVLLNVFQEAYAWHRISPQSEDGSDPLTVLMHVLSKRNDDRGWVVTLVMNLVGKWKNCPSSRYAPVSARALQMDRTAC
jgi:hypothetical protein